LNLFLEGLLLESRLSPKVMKTFFFIFLNSLRKFINYALHIEFKPVFVVLFK